MIKHLVLFGATGDLAGRFILPALAELAEANFLPSDFRITATSDRQLEDFRAHLESAFSKHAKHVSIDAQHAILDSCRYIRGDSTLKSDIQHLLPEDRDESVLYYLALPPQILKETISVIAATGLHPDSRIVIEKPFGQDLHSAIELSELLSELFGDDVEHRIFNVDHALGRVGVQALTELRRTNPMIEAVWNSEHIAEFNIVWEETLALEGRVDFYDKTGALKDVMQNHLMQVLSLSTMTLPDNRSNGHRPTEELRQRKTEALEAVCVPSKQDAAHNSRRGRYTEGVLNDEANAFITTVEGYLDAAGVDAARETETFAEVLLSIDTPRWAGTRFRLRTGKALAKLRKGIEVVFRPSHDDVPAPKLWIGLNGPHTLELQLNTVDADGQPTTVHLTGPQPTSQVSPYANVLKNCLEGSSELSVSTDEALRAWQILTPFLDAWSNEDVPMETYPAGSTPPYLMP